MLTANRKRSRREQADPTKRGANRKQAGRALNRRIRNIQREARQLFADIPYTRKMQQTIVNAEAVYEYDYGEQEATALAAMLLFISNRELMETQGDTPPRDWYYRPHVETAFRSGALEENRDFNTLVVGAVAAGVLVDGLSPQPVPPERLLFSQSYRSALGKTIGQNATTIKGLSQTTSQQVYRVINNGVTSGKSPADIAKEINKRFDVAKSNAKRIANTEVNKAYNDARIEAGKVMAQETGLRSGVLHISALLPTTRPHHAARHGLAFTPEQQQAWWAEGVNRINCYCSVRPVLIDDNNQVVDATFQQSVRDEKAFFD